MLSILHNDAVASGNWRHELVEHKGIWAQAIHRIVTEGISPAGDRRADRAHQTDSRRWSATTLPMSSQ